jgi:hypothetical protein
MEDRELLELAAKAVGLECEWSEDEKTMLCGYTDHSLNADGWYWNPLKNDGDALRLAVRLNIGIVDFPDTVVKSRAVGWKVGPAHCSLWEPEGTDPCAAVRKCITRAAAEIGKGGG